MNSKSSFALVLLCIALSFSSISAQNPDWDYHVAQAGIAYEQHKYDEAEKHLKAALNIAERFASNDTRISMSIRNLAQFYLWQARYKESEPLLKRVLEIDGRIMGFDEPYILNVTKDLALTYSKLSKYSEAEDLLKQALKKCEMSLGADDPEVAALLNSLAVVYTDQGKYAEAEPMFKRALAVTEKTTGRDSFYVIEILEGYAKLLREIKREAQAAEMEARVKDIRFKNKMKKSDQ